MTDLMLNQQLGRMMIGTAAWGQKVEKSEAFLVTRYLHERKFRWIDTATNYPIDGLPDNFGLCLSWLQEFCKELPDLKILVKLGAASNTGESKNFLNVSYLSVIFDLLEGKLGKCLGGISLHWDDGLSEGDVESIVDFFFEVQKNGYEVGLSGIRNHQEYGKIARAREIPWIYQINVAPNKLEFIERDIASIRSSLPAAKFFGYNSLGGLSGQGITLDHHQLGDRQAPPHESGESAKGIYLENIVDQVSARKIDGLIVGPTNVRQAEQWFEAVQRHSLA